MQLPPSAWYSVVGLLAVTISLDTARAADPKQRVFVLTDISIEPDDEQSMVRFLVYSNEYDVEGLVATTSTWLRKGTREDLIRRQIEAYGKVRDNLLKHAAGYPTTGQLLAVTCTGQPTYGMAAVGNGKSTAGSKLLIEAADRADDRPLWVSVWAGGNTLAQALWDVRRSRTEEERERFIRKLRVDTISDQDDSGRWMRTEFPDLFYSEIICTWFVYPEAGTCKGEVELSATSGHRTTFQAPEVDRPVTIHVILQVEDRGEPSLVAYRRVVVEVRP